MCARARRQRGRLPAAALLLAVALGCSRPQEFEPVVDLVEDFASAEVSFETPVIDFGTPPAGNHLLRGWSWSEKSRDGTSFVWSRGTESAVEFFLAAPRPLELRMRCLGYQFADGEPQGMAVELNGHPVAEVELLGDWREVELSVPAEILVVGDNEIVFRYRRVADDGRSARRLGVAFDWVRLSEAAPPQPRALPERQMLILGGGARIDYFLDAPAGARLAIDEARVESAGGRVTIEVEHDGGRSELLAEIAESSGERQWPLGGEGGLVRLRLELPPTAAGDGEGIAALLRPRIVAPRRAAPAVERAAAERVRRDTEPPPHVILYLVDTLRADHLGFLGYSKEISPRLDEFAADAVVYDAAIAQAPWTLPSMASVFTGLNPRTHGVNSGEKRLPTDVTTLAELFQDAGYATGAVVANGFVSAAFGFDKGFDAFEFFPSIETRAENLLARANDWLDSVGDERPVFLFIHSIDPHDSYAPPAPFAPAESGSSVGDEIGSRERMLRLKESPQAVAPEVRDRLVALYDGEIAYADFSFGRFMDELRRRGLYDSSLIVFLADHGEEFYDHGKWTHGHSLHAELIDVPLVVRFPGGEHAGTRSPAPVQQVDLLPTLVDYVGLARPEGLEGRSLLRHLDARDDTRRELANEPILSYLEHRQVGLVRGRWKLIAEPVGGKLKRRALYDRTLDPRETRNLAAERPVVAGFLASETIKQLLARRREVASARTELDAGTAENLRALGYLQ